MIGLRSSVAATFLLATLLGGCASVLPLPGDECRYTEAIVRHPPIERVRIAVVGDIGADAEGSEENPLRMEELVRALATVEDLDAVLILGDNFYHCGLETSDDWLIMKPLADLRVPLYPVLGKHDYGCGDEIDVCRQLRAEPKGGELDRFWKFLALNYAVTWEGLATVLLLDTPAVATGHVRPAAMAERMEDVFDEAPATWRILAGHHVFYSSGFHGSPLEGRARDRMRRLLPAARDAGVSLFLSGHDHDLELVRLGDDLFVISGAGSKVRRFALTRAPGSLFRFLERGFVLLDLSAAVAVVRTLDLDGRPLAPDVRVSPER